MKLAATVLVSVGCLWLFSMGATARVALPMCDRCHRRYRWFVCLRAVLHFATYAVWLFLARTRFEPWQLTDAGIVLLGLSALLSSRDRFGVTHVRPNRVWFRRLHPAALEAYSEAGTYVDGRWRPHACRPVRGNTPRELDDIYDGGPGPVSVATASESTGDSRSERVRLFYRSAEERVRALGLALVALTGTGAMVVLVRGGLLLFGHVHRGSIGEAVFLYGLVLLMTLATGALCVRISLWLYRLELGGQVVVSVLAALTIVLLMLGATSARLWGAAITTGVVLWTPHTWTVFGEDYRERVAATPSLTRTLAVVTKAVLIGTLWIAPFALPW
jgi:hypothetical protein